MEPTPYRPYIIGIAGGTSSGKTTMALSILAKVGKERVAYISFDSYYKDLSHLAAEDRLSTNFDHPDALDISLLVQHLSELRDGRSVEVPTYDFRTCTRLAQTQHLVPRDVIIIDGILALAIDDLRDMFDLKIYVDLSADERLGRRLERDVVERGRTVESVLLQYRDTVRPMHDRFVEPSKKYADIVVPGEVTKSPALEVVAGTVLGRIEEARRRAIITALQQVSEDLSSTEGGHKAVLSRIAQVAQREMSADNVTIHQYDQVNNEFLHADEFSVTWPPTVSLQQPRVTGVSAYVVRHGTKIVENVDEEPDQELVQTAHIREGATKAFIGVQLQLGEELLGVVFFNYLKPKLFTLEESILANVLGSYAALAILRARLDEQTMRRAAYLGDLLSHSYSRARREIVAVAGKEMGADSATLHRYDQPRGRFLDASEFSAIWPPSNSLQQPRESGVSAYVIKHGTKTVGNVEEEPDQELVETVHIRRDAVRAFIGVRLQLGDEILGVLFFNYGSPRHFSAYQQTVAGIWSTFAALAIHGARLYEETEQRAEHLQTLSRVGTDLLATDYASMKNEVVRVAAKTLQADSVTLHQYDQDRSEFLNTAEFSAAWPPTDSLQRPRDDGASAHVIKNGTKVVENIHEEREPELVHTPHFQQSGFKAFLGLRLEARGQAIGVLFFNYLTAQRFDQERLALASVLSFYASAAIYSARLIESQLATEHMKRKAQEAMAVIQADIPHFLKGSIGLIQDCARELLKDTELGSTKQREMLSVIRRKAQEAGEELRASLASHNPPSPQWVRVGDLVADAIERAQLKYHAPNMALILDVSDDLPTAFVDRIYMSRVFVELIRNAQKAIQDTGREHGSIEISARKPPDRDQLEVLFRNDGVPIPQSEWEAIFKGMRLGSQGAGQVRGLGLSISRTILEMQGGNIRVLDSSQTKTTFILNLPITQIQGRQ